MKKAFVISDIHGMYDHFIKLLEHWNRDDKLVILGDMIDRGPESLKVVQHIMTLSQNHDVTVLQGNHDQMIQDFIDDPYFAGQMYCQNCGETTMRSFTEDNLILYKSFTERAEIIQLKCKRELDFLKSGHLYYEFGNVLFTHAGFCSWRENWKETTDNQFTWIRDHFKHKNNSGFVNVFGHTPTRCINHNESDDIWVSDDKLYIAIDGGCAYGGQLNGVLINYNGELLESYKAT